MAPSKPDVQAVAAGDSWLDERVFERLKQRGLPLLEAYAELFTLFSCDRTVRIDFESLLNSLEETPQDRRTMAFVSGYPGTGKSTFLLCLAYAQKDRYEKGRSKLFPVPLNLREFIHRSETDASTGAEIGKEFAGHMESVIGKLNLPATVGILLLIDGCDEYYRHRRQSPVDRALEEQAERLARRDGGRVVKVIAVGQGEDSFPRSIYADTLKWAEKRTFVDLGRIAVNESNTAAIIQAFVHANEHPNEEQMVAKITKLIHTLGIPELDVFVLSLLETAVRRAWNAEDRGIGSLYFNYCRERVQAVAGHLAATNEGCRELIKILAEATFQIYVPESEAFDHVLTEAVQKHPAAASVIPQMVAEIPHLHASVKEFLIAEHAIALILSSDMPVGTTEGAIYPYGTNRFVKSIINRSTPTQHEIFDRIEKLIPKAHTRQRIHLAYILGRFRDRNVRQSAKHLLRNLLKGIEGERPDYASLDVSAMNIDARNWLLLQRTIYISLIYLEDTDAAAKYLLEMLEHPICDNLNRGFHLQYYQDLKRPPASRDMIEVDAPQVPLLKTFDVLFDKLESDVYARTVRAMSCVELYTLCSLCVNRHVVGELSDRHRERLHAFVAETKAEDFHFPKDSWPFIEMSRDLLSRKKVSIGEIFSELHGLKEKRRAGWNATHPTQGTNYVRICPTPESVSDHIWGAMLIARCFLPNAIPGHLEYSREKVLDMLLIHDLSEAYLGDKPAFAKTDEDRLKEDRCMARIIALGTLDAFTGVLEWRRLWSEWRDKSKINARIASDVDAIESYVQMRRYHSNPQCSIPDALIWAEEVAEKLSEHGQRIFASLRHPRAGLLSWH